LLDAFGRVPGDHVLTAVEQAAERPGMRVADGTFWDSGAMAAIGRVDAVLLYDVLMRAVAPDWDELLAHFAPITSGFVICNPQWQSDGEAIRLIDLGRERYLEVVPRWPGTRELFDQLDAWDPGQQRRYRDGNHVFQWGITDIHLKKKLAELGFTLDREATLGPLPGSEGFVQKTFVFCRS